MNKTLATAAVLSVAFSGRERVVGVSSSRVPMAQLATALTSACVAPAEASDYAYGQPIAQLRRQSRYTESARQQSLRAKARR
jgi:hypothetical protein